MNFMQLTRPDGEEVWIVKEMVVSWDIYEFWDEDLRLTIQGTKINLLNNFQCVRENVFRVTNEMT
jgi:hypothetical protein